VKILTIIGLGLLLLAGCGVSAASKSATAGSAGRSAAAPTVTESITITETVTEQVIIHPLQIDRSCPSSQVHYGRLPDGARLGGIPKIPWIADDRAQVVGALFYYGTTPFDSHPARALIGTHGSVVPGANTKILWWTASDATRLTVRGHRLDGSGSFTTELSPASGGGTVGSQFPSIVAVPHAGCWRIDAQGGASSGSVTLQAYDVTD
jgi:hypothetical protein